MANDTNAILHQDDWKIDMNDAWQVLWWCRQLGLSKSELEQAVHAAGTIIDDIKRYLIRQQAVKTDTPPAKSPEGTSHIAGRNRLNRSPF